MHYFTLIAILLLPLSVLADGPLVTEADFFANHVAEGVPRTVPSFAAHVRSHLDAKKTTPEWPEFWSGKRFATIEAAAKSVMDYRFKTCGVWHQYEKGKIDWRFNPTYNGYREYVWQLGRHYFLTDLAAYYSVTNDPQAAATWRDIITSWIRQATCDEKMKTGFDGTCWRSLDAALRVEGWSRQFPVFKDAPILDDEFVVFFMRSVWEHGRHLRRFPTSRNWLVYEMTGLLRLAVTFPFFRESAEWKEFALATLEKEIGAQLYPDGFHYELSSGYHSVIDENYGTIYNFLKNMDEPAPKFLDAGLDKAFALYTYLVRPDGRLPALNDAGEALIKPVMERACGFYPDRQDFRWFATGGRKGAPPPFTSIALPWSGAVVMRTGWGTKDIWAYMDCGPVGRGHQHEDKLNVLLWAYGHEMLTEGGIYNYDTSEMRQYVLRTCSHNTGRIDNRGQNRRAGYVWHAEDLYQKAPFKFAVTSEVEWAQADYTEGYGDKREVKASHRRTLIFYKAVEGLKPFFVIVDRLAAHDGQTHEYEIIWHLEKCAFTLTGAAFTAEFGGGVGLGGAASTDAFVDKIGQKTPTLQGWKPVFDAGDHEHRPIHTPVLCGAFTGAKRIVTVLCPYDKGLDPVVAVKADDEDRETLFTIILSDGHEVQFDENDLPPAPLENEWRR